MSRNSYSEIVADQNHVHMLDGMSYRWFDFGSIPGGGTKEYLFLIPSDVDLLFYGRGFSGRTTNLQLEVFSGPTFSDEGTPMQSRMFNRNSDFPNNNKLLSWEDPVLLTDGSLSDIDETAGSTQSASGNKGSTGSQTSQEFPRIMPKGVYIMSRITNLSATEAGSFVYKLFWSEVAK